MIQTPAAPAAATDSPPEAQPPAEVVPPALPPSVQQPEQEAAVVGESANGAQEPAPQMEARLRLATTAAGVELDFLRSTTATYGAAAGWEIEVVPKGVSELRLDVETAALAEQMPDLVVATGEQIQLLASQGLIQPVSEFLSDADFLPIAMAAAHVGGTQWGIPIETGDHLVLFYNRQRVTEPPGTTDALLAMQTPEGSEFLLAADDRSPAWLASWLGGFGGTIVSGDQQPALNTPATVNMLFFLKELRDRNIIPMAMSAGSAVEAFQSGRAAMLIASAWTLASLVGTEGVEVGVAPLPLVASTGMAPTPYVSGSYLAMSTAATGARVDAARGFAAFLASPEVQTRVAGELWRMPASSVALQGELVQADPRLSVISASLADTMPLPTPDVRRVLEAAVPVVAAMLDGEQNPEDTALEMQEAASRE